ncbi:MAG: PP2C family protein-serine/threonine phosphatase [Armatimonadota bacterium]
MEGGPVRVLVCEDEGITALRLQTALSRFGYEVVGRASNGLEAVDRTRREHPDVILMDVEMPQMDGVRALEQIMAESPTAVVMLTAYSDPASVERAVAAGASGYLVKPVRDEQLPPAISVALTQFAASRRSEEAMEQAHRLAGERDRAEALVSEASLLIDQVRAQATDLHRQLDQERDVACALARLFLCDVPEIPGLEIATHYEPASEASRVGGDYYDFIWLSERHLGIVIGDVCGKGLDAAAYTAVARHTLRAYAFEDASPSSVVERLNHALSCHTFEESTFLSLVYGVLDLDDFSFRYTNAGHPAPLLCQFGRPDGIGCHWLESTGGLVGAVPSWTWEERVVTLRLGELLLLFTDGLIETRDEDGEFLGLSGLTAVLEREMPSDGGQLVRTVVRTARSFSRGGLQDDLALVAIRRMTG